MIARMKTQRFLYLHPLIPHVGRYHLLRSIRSRSTARRGQKTAYVFKSQSRKRARHCLRPDGYL
jgi:hypothetical protein